MGLVGHFWKEILAKYYQGPISWGGKGIVATHLAGVKCPTTTGDLSRDLRKGSESIPYPKIQLHQQGDSDYSSPSAVSCNMASGSLTEFVYRPWKLSRAVTLPASPGGG